MSYLSRNMNTGRDPESVPMDVTMDTVPTIGSDTHVLAAGGATANKEQEQAPLRDPDEAPSSGAIQNGEDLLKYKHQPSPDEVVIRKPIAFLLAFLVIGSLGAFGFSFAKWMQVEAAAQDAALMREAPICEFSASDIAGLELQLDNLEAAVSQLTEENQRLKDSHGDCNNSNGMLSDELQQLEEEIDRLEAANAQLVDQLLEYEALNDRLNATVIELGNQNQILSDNNDEYERLNNQLNESLAALRDENAKLAEQVNIFAQLNENLNATVVDLNIEVDRLEGQVDELGDQNDRLETLVGSLSNETDRLWTLSDALQADVDRLEVRISELSNENDRLEVLVGDLETVASFLNETANNLDETYESLASFLSEQITTNRRIVVETLQNTYQQRVANWDCALRDQFALEPFASNGILAIPGDKYPEVLAFVEERVLSELCLDMDDFGMYFESRYAGQDRTLNGLITSVQRYTWEALDYYFPERGEVGLSETVWADAMYNCERLPSSLQFTM